jgi:hypothetical protein
MTTTTELTPIEQSVINVLGADYPETARMMNDCAITEEAICGRGVVLQDDALPPVECYDEYEAACKSLAEQGLAKAVDVFDMNAYCLTEAGRAQVK